MSTSPTKMSTWQGRMTKRQRNYFGISFVLLAVQV